MPSNLVNPDPSIQLQTISCYLPVCPWYSWLIQLIILDVPAAL